MRTPCRPPRTAIPETAENGLAYAFARSSAMRHRNQTHWLQALHDAVHQGPLVREYPGSGNSTPGTN